MLPKEIIIEVDRMLKLGKSESEIKFKTGVSRRTIYNISLNGHRFLGNKIKTTHNPSYNPPKNELQLDCYDDIVEYGLRQQELSLMYERQKKAREAVPHNSLCVSLKFRPNGILWKELELRLA